MDLELNGKAVMITGGARGIGFACARLLREEGARVAIVSKTSANVERACAELGAAGFAADLRDAEEARRAVEAVEEAIGPIEILINSAGAAKRTPPDELSPEAWRAAMDAKYFSYINVMDPVVKRMAARGSGVIVNVIGNGGKVASPTHLPGGAANAALMLATAGLAAAYADRGVRVLAVNPGITATDRVSEGLASEARLHGISKEEALQRSVARIPLGRVAQPREIAETVAYLASPRAGYVTGVTITMDGAATATVV